MKKTAEPLVGIKRIARIILLSLFLIALITILLHNNPITAIKTMIQGYGDFNNVTSEEERSAQKIIDDGLQNYDNAEKELDRILAEIELSGGVQMQKTSTVLAQL